jgi:hypothetical protein
LNAAKLAVAVYRVDAEALNFERHTNLRLREPDSFNLHDSKAREFERRSNRGLQRCSRLKASDFNGVDRTRMPRRRATRRRSQNRQACASWRARTGALGRLEHDLQRPEIGLGVMGRLRGSRSGADRTSPSIGSAGGNGTSRRDNKAAHYQTLRGCLLKIATDKSPPGVTAIPAGFRTVEMRYIACPSSSASTPCSPLTCDSIA